MSLQTTSKVSPRCKRGAGGVKQEGEIVSQFTARSEKRYQEVVALATTEFKTMIRKGTPDCLEQFVKNEIQQQP